MIIGLIGAHRTGKTTLAERLAQDFSFTFHRTSITESARKMGIDPVAPMALPTRIQLQQHLLLDFLEQVDKQKGPIIVDRTPIDMAGYLLAEFHMQSHLIVNDDLQAQVKEYVEACTMVMNNRFLTAMICRPLPNYVAEAGKPDANPAYQHHCQYLMEGLALRVDRRCRIVHFEATDFETRVGQAHTFLETILNAADVNRRTNPAIH